MDQHPGYEAITGRPGAAIITLKQSAALTGTRSDANPAVRRNRNDGKKDVQPCPSKR